MDMAVCRYNKAHKVKRSRLFIHEMKCPDAKTSKLQTCPYNQQHKVSFENMDKHKRTCPDRPIIDDKLQEEMKNYIQMMNNCNEPPKANEFSEEKKEEKKINDGLNNQSHMTFSSVNVNELFDDCNMGNNVYDYEDINYDISMESVNTRKKDESTDSGIIKKENK